MTIGELARVCGVSVRTLRHYDDIGLLTPETVTEAGYRLYGEGAVEKLSLILLMRELNVPLREIGRMLDTPGFDPLAALEEQIARLEEKRKHIDNLILLARGVQIKGLGHYRFTGDDLAALDETVARIGDTWQNTPEMREFKRREAGRTQAENEAAEAGFNALIASFGTHPDDPRCDEAMGMVQRLRDYISENAYECRLPILRGLADLYDGGGSFTRNIDAMAGDGTALWLAQAVRAYCDRETT